MNPHVQRQTSWWEYIFSVFSRCFSPFEWSVFMPEFLNRLVQLYSVP